MCFQCGAPGVYAIRTSSIRTVLAIIQFFGNCLLMPPLNLPLESSFCEVGFYQCKNHKSSSGHFPNDAPGFAPLVVAVAIPFIYCIWVKWGILHLCKVVWQAAGGISFVSWAYFRNFSIQSIYIVPICGIYLLSISQRFSDFRHLFSERFYFPEHGAKQMHE